MGRARARKSGNLMGLFDTAIRDAVLANFRLTDTL